MATLHPFRALRPVPEKVEVVASVPYDVISTEEARQMARGNPESFLHVIRPEVDFPSGIDEHGDAVYDKGAENLHRYAQSTISLQEEAPALYVYRLVMHRREQTGLFGCVAVAEYDDDIILKHENTRPDKEDDRTRHMVAIEAQTGVVFLTYRQTPLIDAAIEGVCRNEPLFDFEAPDGVHHTVWRATREQTTGLVSGFAAGSARKSSSITVSRPAGGSDTVSRPRNSSSPGNSNPASAARWRAWSQRWRSQSSGERPSVKRASAPNRRASPLKMA